jgi:branched-chain amino acid transport system substrate-binding protein
VKQKTIMVVRVALLVGVVLSVFFMGFAGLLQAAEPIRIGAIFSITGWAAAIGTPPKEAVQVLVDDINKKGGVLGRQIEVYYEDDQSNPTNSAIAATKLVRDKNVDILIASTLTVFTMPVIPVVEREQVPLMAFGAGHDITVPLKKWVFRVPLTDYRLSPMMLKFASEAWGAKKIALLHSTDSSGVMGAKGVEDAVANYGMTIVATERFETTDLNMIPQLTKIKAANPDAVVLYTSASPAAVIAKNYQQLGLKMPVVTNHGVPNPEFLAIAGKIPDVDGGRWVSLAPKTIYASSLPPDDPYRKNLYDPFRKLLQERFPKSEVTAFCANGYDTINVIVQALNIAKSSNRAALRDALEKVKFKGLNSTYVYTPTDHDGQTGEGYDPIMIKDGKWAPFAK